MQQLCCWSEDSLSARHPRYARFFRRPNADDSDGGQDREHQIDVGNEPPDDEKEGGNQDIDAAGSHAGHRPRRSGMIAASRAERRTSSSPSPQLPAPPQPSADTGLHKLAAGDADQRGSRRSSISSELGVVDIWGMNAVEAVNLLCAYVDILLAEAGRKPPKPLSPPVSSSSSGTPSRSATPAPQQPPPPPPATFSPQDVALSSSHGHVASGRSGRETHQSPRTPSPAPQAPEVVLSPASTSPEHPHLQRVPRASRTPIDSPISNPRTPIHSVPPSPRLPHIVVTVSDREIQSRHLAKRFFCKSVPNVSLAAYLGRIHKYCHMSTAVYLAAGIYIERLSQAQGGRLSFLPLAPRSASYFEKGPGDQDPIVDLTPRSVHRLLLAALRVANKALSDLYWPHKRVADVGGVSQLELQRLEVSLCYLCDFKLQVSLGDLEKWVKRAWALGAVCTSGADR